MIKLQGVIILRISDFRRYFSFHEFWQKKDDFLKLFQQEFYQSCEEIQPYLFSDTQEEAILVYKLSQWLENPKKELCNLKLYNDSLKVEDTIGNVHSYNLGKLSSYIEEAKRNNLTNKMIVGLTLLYLLLDANKESSNIKIEYFNHLETSQISSFNDFNILYDDIVLERANSITQGLRRCVFINKNSHKNINIVLENVVYKLEPNTCVVAVFVGDLCYDLLPNLIVNQDLGITVKLSVNNQNNTPRCEIHKVGTNVEVIPNVLAIAIDKSGKIIYLDSAGRMHYDNVAFDTYFRIKSFLSNNPGQRIIGFKEDISGNLIFYTPKGVYH